MKFERLTQGRAFGPLHRYRIDKCKDRFGNIVYMMFDAELIDDFTGGPSCIRQDSTREDANDASENRSPR